MAQTDFDEERDKLPHVCIAHGQIALGRIGVLRKILERFHVEIGFKFFPVFLRPCVSIHHIRSGQRLGKHGHGGGWRRIVQRLAQGGQRGVGGKEQAERCSTEQKKAFPMRFSQKHADDQVDHKQQDGHERTGVVIAGKQREDERKGKCRHVFHRSGKVPGLPGEKKQKIDEPCQQPAEEHVACGAGHQQMDDRKERIADGHHAEKGRMQSECIKAMEDMGEKRTEQEHLCDGIQRNAGIIRTRKAVGG